MDNTEPLLEKTVLKDYTPTKTFVMVAGYALFTVAANIASKLLQTEYDVSVYDIAWYRSATGVFLSLFNVPLHG
jgi:hypothetical protein